MDIRAKKLLVIGGARQSFPVSEELARAVLSLPMSADLTSQDQERVVGAISDAARLAA